MKPTPVACENCPKTWPREPAFEVDCPTCGVKAGSACVTRRPSEHVHSAAFSGLPPWGHDERDIAADLAGCYGECPKGTCGLRAKAARDGRSLEETVEIRRREIARGKKKRGAAAANTELELSV